jgi:transcriptional regulator with XRE-family HTH domain
MNTLTGTVLKDLRTEWGKSLKDISSNIGVSLDLLSKIEKGQRNPTPTLLVKLSTYYDVDTDQLLEFYYSDQILTLMDGFDKSESVLKLVRKRLKSPHWVPYSKSSTTFLPLTKSLKPKRVYTKGGKNGKVKGMNYYVQPNEKLSKKNRTNLLKKSEIYFNEVRDRYTDPSILNQIPMELDSTHTDIELIDQWNDFYDRWGGEITEFKDSVEKELISSFPNQPIEDEFNQDSKDEIQRNMDFLKKTFSRFR